MRAILCGRGKGGGCRVVEFTEQQLETAHAEHYPEQYQGKLAMTDKPAPDNATLDGGEDDDGKDEPQLSPMKPFAPEPPADYWPVARVERSPRLVRIPANTPMELCKDPNCRKRIWMVKHPTTGKPTPAACEETVKLPKDGAVVPTGAFPPYLNAKPGRETLPMDGLGYSHFIDCPSSKAFRKS